MTEQQKPRYQFTPSAVGADAPRAGVVTIYRPLNGDDADLFETGPMFRVRYEHGPAGFADAFYDELAPIGAAEAPAWGEWWDAEDHESSGAVQHYIETGRRQSRRESFEFSVAAERVMLAAEAVVTRAAAGVSA